MPDPVDPLGCEQMVRPLAHWQSHRRPGGPRWPKRLST
jgi:hypothetical protein